jgi:hypothetical protein
LNQIWTWLATNILFGFTIQANFTFIVNDESGSEVPETTLSISKMIDCMADGFALIDFDRDIQYNQEFARLFTITKQSEVWEKLKLTHTTK